jgi:PIN domain nuclease of toxin-antitoxin system
MKLLLDTQVFLWFLSADQRLPVAWRDAISDPANDAWLSVASVWEAVIKSQLGKLPLPGPAETYLPEGRDRHGISSLPIDETTIKALASLPPHHRDPFDRVIVAQAIQHGCTLVTADAALKAYPVAIFA